MKKNEYLSEDELLELIAHVEENEMIQAPFYLKQEILQRVEEESLDKTKNSQKKSANIQFLTFSLKVALATAASIAVLFLVPAESESSNMPTQIEQESETFSKKLLNKSYQISGGLGRVTNRIVNKEDWKYDKEKEE